MPKDGLSRSKRRRTSIYFSTSLVVGLQVAITRFLCFGPAAKMPRRSWAVSVHRAVHDVVVGSSAAGISPMMISGADRGRLLRLSGLAGRKRQVFLRSHASVPTDLPVRCRMRYLPWALHRKRTKAPIGNGRRFTSLRAR